MPDNQELKLLDCPFCGGKAAICQWRDTENPNATWVECTNCGVCQESKHDEDADFVKGIAAMLWNTRVPDTELIEAAENLLKLSACSGQENGIWNALAFAVEKAKSKGER